MKKVLLLLLTVSFIASCTPKSSRIVEDFNFDWTFILDDCPEFAQKDFNDSSWRQLHLPHDWAIEGQFAKENPSTANGGALPGGIGWYRKHFTVPQGERVFVEFDGVFMNSTVYINGVEIGTRPYGYSSFSYDITDALCENGDNVIAVRCDNLDQPNSRWYGGCGIYRNVRLVTVGDSFVAYNGVYVTTPKIAKDEAQVHAQIELAGEPVEALRVEVLDPKRRKVASTQAKRRQDGVYVANLTVKKPQLWDLENSSLYTLVCSIPDQDIYSQTFGFRTLAWDAKEGFFLNGEKIFLKGVCMHHDMGCIGTAIHPRALERQIQMLKDMGCNAIRTSHNPPAPQLLDLCDRMGILVIDEAMDMWRKRKTQYDYARFFDDWHEADVRDFIRRDRNHPCVILWSVGNEILEQWNSSDDIVENLTPEQANTLLNFMSSLPQYQDQGENYNSLLTRHMVDIVKDMDTTRLVTAGLSETLPINNLIRSGSLEVYGFNYHTYHYDSLNVWYPDIPMFGSETASGLMSRGWYEQPSTEFSRQPQEWWMEYETPHHQCSAYDCTCAPWSDTHEWAWYSIKTHPYMAGCFIWTGFDYLGEPTPYQWPSRSSYFGIVDLAGFPKDIYYMYQSEWCSSTNVLHLFPHWNWQAGDKVDMWCYYNNADSVELFVNGVSQGVSCKEGDRLHAWWLQVPYESGVVEAVAYMNGKEVRRQAIETTSEPVGLRLLADRRTIEADGYDLSFVTVEMVDAQDRLVSTASSMLTFSVEGCGELYGVDNGNAAGTLSLKGSRMPLFAGKALAVVRSLKDEKGQVVLTVKSEEGYSQTIVINTK